MSPSAEHLEEPSIIGRRESQQQQKEGAPEPIEAKLDTKIVDDQLKSD